MVSQETFTHYAECIQPYSAHFPYGINSLLQILYNQSNQQ